jgi:uridylate kinase
MQKFKRILLKLSGESLAGNSKQGIDAERLMMYVSQIAEVAKQGVEVAIVIGGGNIFRGLRGEKVGFDRVKGDYMGMLATMINGLALQSAFETEGIEADVLTAFYAEPVGERYTKNRAIHALKQGRVVILTGGTGNPFFTTDTGAALRAIEIQADIILKGTRVDGVYDSDPEKNPLAVKFNDITFNDIYEKGLEIMDLTAFTMCRENNMPVYVFDMDTAGNLLKVIAGEDIGTMVHN